MTKLYRYTLVSTLQAFTRYIAKAFKFNSLPLVAMIFTIINHSLSNRMRCAAFKSHHDGHVHTFITTIVFEFRYIEHALCKGTCFIHNDSIEFTGFFKIFRTLDENTMFCAKARTYHDGCWCSKAKRTWTSNY